MDKAFVISPKTMKDLLDNPDKRSKQGLRDFPILLLLSLGLRRGEVCALDLADFDRTGWLQVRTTKKGMPRKVRLTAEIVAAIEGYRASRENGKKPMQDDHSLFSTLGKFGPWPMRRITPMCINGLVNRAVKKAGIKENVTPHSFRHNCATTMLRQGRDLKTVQTVLGHRSIQTTSMYLHSMDVSEAFEDLPWLRKDRQKR